MNGSASRRLGADMVLDTIINYGNAHHMNARRVFHDRMEYSDGAILEMTIWAVPVPVKGSARSLKYSLFYGRPGRRIVGYDNERGKGDHRPLGDTEEPYAFTTPEALLAASLADVETVRAEL